MLRRGRDRPGAALSPVCDAEFAALMEPLGPWGGTDRIAVAVSGGPIRSASAFWPRAGHRRAVSAPSG